MLSVLTAAVASQDPLYGTLLLLAFSLGRGIPLVVVGLLIDRLTRLEQITPYVAVGEKIFGGGFLLLAGYYFYQGWRYVQVLSQ